jgi:Rod binding domain-containing protein
MEIQGPRLLDLPVAAADGSAERTGVLNAARGTGDEVADRAGLEQAAREFEGVFLNTLLKAMRETVPESELFNGGGATKFYRQMHDAEIAKSLAGSSGGMGIADMIVNQLAPVSAPARDGAREPAHPPVGPPAPKALARYRTLEPVSDFRTRMIRTRMLASSQGTAVADTLHRYEKPLASAARANGLDPALVLAVMMEESGGDAAARSPKGAFGLMQLMPATAREVGVTDITDPGDNLAGGARYLARMLERFDGRLDLALAAYNAGPGAVMAAGERIPAFAETVRYVGQVMDRYRNLGGGMDLASDRTPTTLRVPEPEDGS